MGARLPVHLPRYAYGKGLPIRPLFSRSSRRESPDRELDRARLETSVEMNTLCHKLTGLLKRKRFWAFWVGTTFVGMLLFSVVITFPDSDLPPYPTETLTQRICTGATLVLLLWPLLFVAGGVLGALRRIALHDCFARAYQIPSTSPSVSCPHERFHNRPSDGVAELAARRRGTMSGFYIARGLSPSR